MVSCRRFMRRLTRRLTKVLILLVLPLAFSFDVTIHLATELCGIPLSVAQFVLGPCVVAFWTAAAAYLLRALQGPVVVAVVVAEDAVASNSTLQVTNNEAILQFEIALHPNLGSAFASLCLCSVAFVASVAVVCLNVFQQILAHPITFSVLLLLSLCHASTAVSTRSGQQG